MIAFLSSARRAAQLTGLAINAGGGQVHAFISRLCV